MDRQQQSAADAVLTALRQAERGELPIDLVRRAQVAARQEDRHEFLKIVQQLVDLPALSLSDQNWLDLGGAASDLLLENVSIALYERAVEVHPADQRVTRLYLANLAHCQDPRLRERARAELAELFKVTITDSGVSVPPDIPTRRLPTLAVMLDAYHADGLDKEALLISKALVEAYPQSSVALMNHARALSANFKFDEALEFYRESVKVPDRDATAYNWFAGEIANNHRRANSILLYLMACQVDPDNATNFSQAAEEISVDLIKRVTGREDDPGVLRDQFTEETVMELSVACVSCPTVSTESVDRVQSSLDSVEAGDFFERLIAVRQGTPEDVSIKLMGRATRLRLARELISHYPTDMHGEVFGTQEMA